MAEREGSSHRLPRFPRLLTLIAGLLIVAGCAAMTTPVDGGAPLPSQTVVEPPSAPPPVPPIPETPADPPPPSTPPDPAPSLPPATEGPGAPLDPVAERPKTLIVIDPAEAPAIDESQDLAAAARREKERRRSADKPVAVIDHKNLATWASGGVLTQASETAPSPAESAATEVVEKAAVEEAYWRRRGREIRQRWRESVDQIAVLEAKTEALRNKFYSTDDGFYRDSQVKPEWDKAIADLEEARYQASRGEAEVLAFLEEGRKAGALPGWLREGSELEPEPVVESGSEPPPGALEAREPEIYREPANTEESSEPPSGSPRGRSGASRR